METYPEFIQLKDIMASIEKDKQLLQGKESLETPQEGQDQTEMLYQFEKLQQAQGENQVRVRKMDNDRERQKQVTLDMNQQLVRQSREREQQSQDWQHKKTVLQNELEHREDRIEMLQTQVSLLKEQDGYNRVQQMNYQQHSREVKEQQNHQGTLVQSLREQVGRLEEKNQQLEKQVLNSQQQEVTIHSLQTDKQKLVQLLKCTSEFQDLSSEFHDSSHYKPPVQPKETLRSNTVLTQKVYQDLQYWVPEQAYSFVHRFRLDYDGQLTDTLVDTLLYELNCIWLQKEQEALRKSKEKYLAKISALQRQVKGKQLQPGSSHESLSQVARLESQVSQLRRENRALVEKQAFSQNDRYISEVMRVAKDSDRLQKDTQLAQAGYKTGMQKFKATAAKENKKHFRDGVMFMGDDLLKCLAEDREDQSPGLIRSLEARIRGNMGIV